MITELTLLQIQTKIDSDHWASKILAEVVCSTYWGGSGVDLRELDRLSADNYALAIGIIGYRRASNCRDASFYDLACWSCDRHGLRQWQDHD